MKKILTILWLSTGFVFASQESRFFDISGSPDIIKGDFDNIFLDEMGRIGLSDRFKEMVKLDSTMVWSMLKKGDVFYVGTGDKGLLNVVDASKNTITPINFEKGNVTALVFSPQGDDLYVATSNPSALYRVFSKNNQWEKVADVAAGYVWDMAFYKDKLYLALGSPGKVVRLEEGELKDVMNNKDVNILRLLVANDKLYASSSKRGHLYAIDEQGTFTLLYEDQNADIGDFLFSNGSLYAVVSNAQKNKEDNNYEESYLLEIDKKGNINPLLALRELFSSLTMKGGRLIMSTYDGQRGKLYTYSLKNHETQKIFQLDNQENNFIPFMVEENGKLYFVSSTGSLYSTKQGKKEKSEGVFTSVPLDAMGMATWGHFYYQASKDAAVSFSTRSSMSDKLDSVSWSSWVPLGPKDDIQSPKGRFLQVRAQIQSDSSAPSTVENMRAYYAVRYNDILIKDFIITRDKKLASANGVDLGSDKMAFLWDTNVENKDENVQYRILFKPSQLGNWQKMVSGISGKAFSISRPLFSEGPYDFKLVASRGFLDSERVREIRNYIIDNTPPHSRKVYKQGSLVRLNVVDSYSSIKNFKYSFNRLSRSWAEEDPVDGVFDEKQEEFFIQVPPNAKEIFLYLQDESDNYRYEIFSLDDLKTSPPKDTKD